MEKIEHFKEFVKQNPKLLKHVKSGNMTWQKFYEMYDLYGDTDNIWNEYLTDDNAQNQTITNSATAATTTFGLAELASWLKNIDLDSIQNSISSVQRVLGVVQDLTAKTPDKPKEEYKPRPIYKHFED